MTRGNAGYLSMMMAGMAAGTVAQAAPAPRPPQFAQCGVCHKVVKDEKSPIGPNLWGVGGRKAASVAGFTYSPAMTKSGLKWDRKTLIAFIGNPRDVVPGTRMAFAGQKDPKIAAAIADYLLSLK